MQTDLNTLLNMGINETIRQERNTLIQSFESVIEETAQNAKDVKELEKILLKWCIDVKQNHYYNYR